MKIKKKVSGFPLNTLPKHLLGETVRLEELIPSIKKVNRFTAIVKAQNGLRYRVFIALKEGKKISEDDAYGQEVKLVTPWVSISESKNDKGYRTEWLTFFCRDIISIFDDEEDDNVFEK